jgi:hypothetical protein
VELKVIRELDEWRSGGHRMIEVQCACGEVFSIQKRRLNQGRCAACAGIQSVNLPRQKIKELKSLLKEAAPIMEKYYLRKSWFDRVNKALEE